MLYARKNGYMSTRFEKLVKLSGTNLTQSVYPMITYVQVILTFKTLAELITAQVFSCITLNSAKDKIASYFVTNCLKLLGVDSSVSTICDKHVR